MGTNWKLGDPLWTSGVLSMLHHEHEKKINKTTFFYGEGKWTLEEVTQGGCGVPILGNIWNISGCSPGWLALGGPVGTGGLYQLTSRGSFVHNQPVILGFCECHSVSLCYVGPWPEAAEAIHGVCHQGPGHLAPSPEGLWHMFHSHCPAGEATRCQTHQIPFSSASLGLFFPPQESYLHLLLRSVLEEKFICLF